MELLLVLGLLVMVASLAWPRVTRSLARAEHRAAAETVQTALTQLRLRAIETGTPQMFRFRPGTGEFEVRSLPPDEVQQVDFEAPQGSFGENDQLSSDQLVARSGGGHIIDSIGVDALAAEVATDSVSTKNEGIVELRRLGNGVILLPAGASLPPDLADAEAVAEILEGNLQDPDADAFLSAGDSMDADLGDPASNAVEWSLPVAFYPDGRADDMSLEIVSSTNHRIAVTVIGMTGEVRLGSRERTAPEGTDERVLEDITEDIERSLEAP